LTTAVPQADSEATQLVGLYERHGPAILRFCAHRLGDRDEAEDATQVTFLRALRGLQRGTSLEFESAWLYKIAQNVCLNTQRSAFRRRRLEQPLGFDELEQLHQSVERDADELFGLSAALRSLPERQRTAIVLREWRGWSYDEIASALGLSQAAVETLLFRARRTLAKALRGPRRLASELGSLLTFAKSLLVGGGVKAGATIAGAVVTSVCVATPAVRHAVVPDRATPEVEVVTPVAAVTPLAAAPHDPHARAHATAVAGPVRAERPRAPKRVVRAAPRVQAQHVVANAPVVAAPAHAPPPGQPPVVELEEPATPAPAPNAVEPAAAEAPPAEPAPVPEAPPPAPAAVALAQVEAPAPAGPCVEEPPGPSPDPGAGARAVGRCDVAAPAAQPPASPGASREEHGNGNPEAGSPPAVPPGQANAEDEPHGKSEEPHGRSDEPHGRSDEPHQKGK
jgi:RNA polymerase sigma-70 factor (ECF subfamily)